MIMTMKTVKENSHETMPEYRQAINQTASKQKQYLSSNRDISKQNIYFHQNIFSLSINICEGTSQYIYYHQKKYKTAIFHLLLHQTRHMYSDRISEIQILNSGSQSPRLQRKANGFLIRNTREEQALERIQEDGIVKMLLGVVGDPTRRSNLQHQLGGKHCHNHHHAHLQNYHPKCQNYSRHDHHQASRQNDDHNQKDDHQVEGGKMVKCQRLQSEGTDFTI